MLLAVDPWTGHTAEVARSVGDGARLQGGRVATRSADEATRADLPGAGALVSGSAVHQRATTGR